MAVLGMRNEGVSWTYETTTCYATGNHDEDHRLPACPLTRSPVYPVTRLPDYPFTRLPAYPLNRLYLGPTRSIVTATPPYTRVPPPSGSSSCVSCSIPRMLANGERSQCAASRGAMPRL